MDPKDEAKFAIMDNNVLNTHKSFWALRNGLWEKKWQHKMASSHKYMEFLHVSVLWINILFEINAIGKGLQSINFIITGPMDNTKSFCSDEEFFWRMHRSWQSNLIHNLFSHTFQNAGVIQENTMNMKTG